MVRYFIVVFVVCSLVVFAAGCFGAKEYDYAIEITPTGNSFERKVTCPSNSSSDELDRISKLYRKRLNTYSFVGIFTTVPNDINESGSFRYLDTQMGSTTLYAERFRGSDDLASYVEKVQLSVDRLTDLLIGWFEMELGENPGFEMLRKFCDENLRRDAKNVLIWSYFSEIVPGYGEGHSDKESAIRVYQHFAEQEYFDKISVSEVWGALNQAGGRQDYTRLMALIQRFIAGKMGYNDSRTFPKALAFLSDSSRAKASLERYIRNTDLYKNALEKIRAKADDPKAEHPEPFEVVIQDFGSGALDCFIPIGLSFADKYTFNFRLNYETEPFATNGLWDKEAKQVRYSGTTLKGTGRRSSFFYALWSMPNKAFQKEHFGAVVLEGQALYEYCLWQSGLEKQDAEEWDRFLLNLRPGTELAKQLASFRFTADPPETAGLAEMPRQLIEASLGDSSKPSGP